MKIDNIPVSLEKVMDNKPELVLNEEDPNQYNSFRRNDFLTKNLDEACKLWIKKVNAFKNKILKVDSMNARVLENEKDKEKNITENSRLTYFYKNKKETLANLKSDSNENKCLKAKNLKGLKDN
ncbi:hypothetical protein F8M41_021103 [Gigaspora margarita]|uniref:Uncharacterized protein n=1 Tax=Gigaspora margarita TaxID=4874 RepID=A0A8H4AHF4_GIGMA|nr:hypothetical protein F8M41_021103 [Gigaspora margarita]